MRLGIVVLRQLCCASGRPKAARLCGKLPSPQPWYCCVRPRFGAKQHSAKSTWHRRLWFAAVSSTSPLSSGLRGDLPRRIAKPLVRGTFQHAALVSAAFRWRSTKGRSIQVGRQELLGGVRFGMTSYAKLNWGAGSFPANSVSPWFGLPSHGGLFWAPGRADRPAENDFVWSACANRAALSHGVGQNSKSSAKSVRCTALSFSAVGFDPVRGGVHFSPSSLR